MENNVNKKKSENNTRLQRYLETTNIKEFEFLYRILMDMSNNKKGDLTFNKLLLLDKDVKNIGLEYDIVSERDLLKIIFENDYNHKSHPFLENDKVRETRERVQKLAYLDEIFKNIDNVLDYQGTFTFYKYVKRYLGEVLKDECPQSDKELICKDYDQKLELVLANLSNIASYLFYIKQQTPNSRIAIFNQGLSSTSKGVAGTNITISRRIFAEGIAFGTSLKKLNDRDYEDIKSLIMIPHQRHINK